VRVLLPILKRPAEQRTQMASAQATAPYVRYVAPRHAVCRCTHLPPQFVAAPLGEGYTVAEQLGARPDEGSIQLDVYPCLASSVSCMDAHGRFLELSVTPAEAGLSESATLSMRAA
jgi:hypothetical protein